MSSGRNLTKARVYGVDWRGRDAVLKSVSHQVFWLRFLVGRRALDREERAYRLLAGVRGIPALLARPDRDSLLCERIDGRRLDQHPRRSLPLSVFERLGEIIRQAHERGVAHGDLHRRDVIVDAAGFPWVLDWATGMLRAGGGGRLRRALFNRWMEIDRRAVEKLRRRYGAGDAPGSSELPPAWRPHRWIWRLRRAGRHPGPAPRRRTEPRPADLAANEESSNMRNRVLGIVRLLILFAGVAALVWLARPEWLWMKVGVPLVAAGEVLRWWAAGHLVKSKDLVTSGPYAYTQNPLYLGRLCILIGLGIMCSLPWRLNWAVLAVGLAGFFGYYMPRKLRVEGDRLEGRHGDRWQHYRRSVPVLFPSLSRYADAERRPWSWSRMARNREYLMVLGLGVIVAVLWSRLGA